MKQFEALEIIQQSEKFSKLLAQTEAKLLTWADDKEKLYKSFAKQASRYKKVIEGFPAEWFQASSNQFVAGSIFATPARLRKFLHNQRDFLNKEEKNLLHYFLDNPWFYSLFKITDILPNNILKAQDCSNGKKFYLHSEGTTDLYKQGKNLFMTLLFDNGECYQTYGIIHYYQGYSLQDFISFSYLVSYRYKSSHDLSEAIRDKPIEYMLLDRYAEIPVTIHRDEPIVFCAHSKRVESFDPSDYKERFFIEEKNDVIRCTLKKYIGTMFFTNIYYDRKKRNLLLHAMGLSRYRELVDLLKDKYEFPPEPSWFFSTQMVVAVETILGIKNPSSIYDEHFDDSDAQNENAPDLDPINDLMRELTDYTNTGKSFSIEELASRHDVPLETALQLEAMLQNMDEKFRIDLDGGFDDLVPPPPAEREKFKGSLNNNSIFTIRSISEARIQSLGLGIETQADYIRLIDDLYFKVWGERDYTVLIYTLYLLSIKGDYFEDTDDYAGECLKIFWQVLIPSKSENEIDNFIKKYNRFCSQVLLKAGLIESKNSPSSGIQASDLFYDMFEF